LSGIRNSPSNLKAGFVAGNRRAGSAGIHRWNYFAKIWFWGYGEEVTPLVQKVKHRSREAGLYYPQLKRISRPRLLQKKRQSRLALRAPGPDTSRLDVFAVRTSVRTIVCKGNIMTIGTVKFFNSSKGFGFIAPEGGAKDVFVHATALEAAGMTSLSDGQNVSFDIQPDAKGSKAVNLQNA
jgi:CspA family cold shock protein